MLKVNVPVREWLDEKTNEFIRSPQTTLTLEHSLISVSKWEAKHRKPFSTSFEAGMSVEDFRDYVRCMTIGKTVDQMTYYALSPKNFEQIQQYISDPCTATTIRNTRKNKKRNNKVVTAELVYCWMFSNNIPMECEKWHFNRLMTLIQVCFLENREPEKMSKRDVMKQNSALNAMRRSKCHSKG